MGRSVTYPYIFTLTLTLPIKGEGIKEVLPFPPSTLLRTGLYQRRGNK
jgi:hypothetical protein